MIPVYEPLIGDREIELVVDALESGWVSPQGKYVSEFESRFAEFVGTDYAFAVTSGTAALHLTLVAADIGPGDEVIVPDLTWVACANAVEYTGADPVFVDVDPNTLTLDPEAVRTVASDDTAAIMPVHLYGHPCDLRAMRTIAERHDALLVEDCAEAHGAEYRGQRIGSHGDVGCFSFYGNKMFTTGQGGMITTDDDELAEYIELLRRDGMSNERKYYHPVIGYNYRLTNLQAALGVAQLERADTVIERKRQIARIYQDHLEGAPVDLVKEQQWATSVYWMNIVLLESRAAKERVQRALAANDIETRPLFYPLHRQPPYEHARHSSITVANDCYERGINLPSGPSLSDEEVRRVCDALHDAI